MEERLGFQKAALNEEEVLVRLFFMIEMRMTNGPHGLWHKNQYCQFRLNAPAGPGISLQRLPLSIQVWNVFVVCDCLTVTMELSFPAHVMYQLGVV